MHSNFKHDTHVPVAFTRINLAIITNIHRKICIQTLLEKMFIFFAKILFLLFCVFLLNAFVKHFKSVSLVDLQKLQIVDSRIHISLVDFREIISHSYRYAEKIREQKREFAMKMKTHFLCFVRCCRKLRNVCKGFFRGIFHEKTIVAFVKVFLAWFMQVQA